MPLLGGFGALVTGSSWIWLKRPAEGHSAIDVRDLASRTRADNTAQAAEKTETTTTNVGCPNCQHVQAVPRSQPTFVCEQCNAHLKRRTAPAKSS
jgi:hypothetical protein